MKKILLLLSLFFTFCPVGNVVAQDVTLSDTVWLRKATHIDYDVASWDTVFVDIMRGSVQVQRIFLSSNGKGRWNGYYLPTYDGNFVAEYNAVYSGDTTIEETYFTVLDTTAFMGSAAGITEASIWSYANRTLTSGSGTGANQVTIRVKSSTDSAVVSGATVAVWSADLTALQGLLDVTSDSGKAVFALDNGVYKLIVSQYKFQWTVPIKIGVTGIKDTTVYGTEFTPTPPSYAGMCTVYGYIDSTGLAGTKAKVSVTIHAENLRVGSVVLPRGSYNKTVYTNNSGYWEMTLWPNSLISPSGTTYHFNVDTQDRRGITVPELTIWELTW